MKAEIVPNTFFSKLQRSLKKWHFARRGSKFAKMVIFRRFFEENIQTNVAQPKISVCRIFLQKMKIYMLSFQGKKNDTKDPLSKKW